MRSARAELALLLVAGVAACDATTTPDAGDPALLYLTDAGFRRAELAASLVDPSDGYARLRLSDYGHAWEALPVWNPRVSPVTTADLGAAEVEAQLAAGARALVIDPSASAADPGALLALGEAAFARYPVQLLAGAPEALASAGAAASFGLLADPATGQVGGLVHAEMADGSTRVALTCATCHASLRAGELVRGAPNDALDLGRLLVASGGVATELVARTLAWGPGRVDVSSTDASEPARIPDLRPARLEGWLQQDATVRQRSIASLAIRIETLIVTSHSADIRPPREIALSLALAVWALSASLPDGAAAAAVSPLAARGLTVVETSCSSCHAGDGFTGSPVPLAVVGTDPALGRSPDRGTGAYRVPSLRGVGSRGALLHDASAPSLDVFFDPARSDPGFTGGRAGGPILGHPWNLALGADDRAAALALLREL
jgi:cytochrome c5